MKIFVFQSFTDRGNFQMEEVLKDLAWYQACNQRRRSPPCKGIVENYWIFWKFWAPLRKLFATPGVPSWLRACLVCWFNL